MRTLTQKRAHRRLRQNLDLAVKGEPRVTKSAAASLLGISRRTVIRHAQLGLISEDRRGRVRVGEICRVLTTVPCIPAKTARFLHASNSRLRATETNGAKRSQINRLARISRFPTQASREKIHDLIVGAAKSTTTAPPAR